MATFIVLLRGVNVSGNNRVPMADLKAACAKAGYRDVQSYINSGNLVMTGPGTAAAVERKVEDILRKEFGVEVPVVARTAAQWAIYARAKPFPDAQDKLLHLGLTKASPDPGVVAAIQARAQAGEKAKLVGDAVWIDFADSGVARSKLTPSFLDKAAGSSLTARNWNTVQALHQLASGAP